MKRRLALWTVVLVAAGLMQGCCSYHPETAADMKLIRQKIDPLFNGFTQPPRADEAMKISEIHALFEQSAAREKSSLRACATIHQSILKSQQIFTNDIHLREDVGRLEPKEIELLLDQMNRSLDEVIAAVESRRRL